MTLTPHQETLLSDTHVIAETTKALLEIYIKDINETKNRVTKIERKLNFFMGIWAAVSTVVAGVFTWVAK